MDIYARYRANIIQICIPTEGCRLGNCIFCNYGSSSLLPLETMLSQLDALLTRLPRIVCTAVIDGVGSIWDSNEVPTSYLVAICERLNKCDQLQTVIFETHYMTINEDVCVLVRGLLPNKDLEVEVGIETVNPQNQKNINKVINFDLLQQKLDILKKYNFDAEANVLFGIPFLTKEERLADCIETINWCLDNGFRFCTVFPCNIKLNTRLYDMYMNGEYECVAHTEILCLLNKLSDTAITQIDFSWTGDWFQVVDGVITNKVPLLCEDDSSIGGSTRNVLKDIWEDFYNDFAYCERVASSKRNIVNQYTHLVSTVVKG